MSSFARYVVLLALIIPTLDAWAQQKAASEELAQFGQSVAVSGEWAFVGEPLPRFITRNAVYVYRKVDSSWMPADTLMSPEDGEQFGQAVVLDGNRLFVGAPQSAGVGAVYVFEYDDGSDAWSQSHLIQAGSHVSGSGFGTAIDVEGDLLVVGAPYEEIDGAAYAFERQSDGSWVQDARFLGTRQDAGLFGFSVAVGGPGIVVGAQFSDGRQGLAYSFRRNASADTWSLEQELTASDGTSGDRFGRSVTSAGNTLVVGAPLHADAAGAAYVFVYDEQAARWTETDKLEDSDPAPGWFGWSHSLHGDRLLVGNAIGGSALLFSTDGGGTYASEHTFEDPLGEGSFYAYAVSLDADDALIGARSAESVVPYIESGNQWSIAEILKGGTSGLERVEGRVACVNGMAGDYPCSNVDMLSFMPIDELGTDGSKKLNDIWGWTDPQTGKEYALVGRTDGTAFVDVSNPEAPVLIGSLPTQTFASTWRDVKVVNNHAVIVADNAGDHGMQIFDLGELRSVTSPPATFEATARYDAFGSAHNVAANDDSDHAILVGITGAQSVPSGFSCGPGPHFVDMSDPSNPTFAGCYNPGQGRGYTHDAQCLRYAGPDADHSGADICIGADEVGVSITDVSDPDAPDEVSIVSYPNFAYSHQGWLTEDHRYLLLDDELDETNNLADFTRTLIFDVTDLDDPVFVGEYFGPTTASDHNLYVRDNLVFEANYNAGLRILDLGDDDELAVANIQEVGYFDVFPRNDEPGFTGAWSNYPFFDSGIVIVSGIESGLYVLKPSDALSVGKNDELPAEVDANALRVYPNPAASTATVELDVKNAVSVDVAVFDVVGRRIRVLHDAVLTTGTHRMTVHVDRLPNGVYYIRATGDGVSETKTLSVQH